MTLGEKLKKARLERGLTQSQVCGEHITRNMLSQLENDLASPSVRTLEHLADALGVSVGWLLESDPVREKLDEARQLYRGGAYKECFLLLNCADNIGDEGVLLFIRSALQVCEAALADGRLREAEQVAAALRAVLRETLGDDVAAKTRILYGGSVKAANIAGFMREPNVDGALVGGASLDLNEFSSIVRYQKHVGV